MTARNAYSLINSEIISRNMISSKWADLGCGDGLFTQALSHLLTAGSIIYGIDKNEGLKPRVAVNGVEIISKKLDFVTDDWGLHNLNGVLMANSLHYVKDPLKFIRGAERYLDPGASFLIVEYDTNIPEARWVPYPISFSSLEKLFKKAGYTGIRQLNERPSLYRQATIYSALVTK